MWHFPGTAPGEEMFNLINTEDFGYIWKSNEGKSFSFTYYKFLGFIWKANETKYWNSLISDIFDLFWESDET